MEVRKVNPSATTGSQKPIKQTRNDERSQMVRVSFISARVGVYEPGAALVLVPVSNDFISVFIFPKTIPLPTTTIVTQTKRSVARILVKLHILPSFDLISLPVTSIRFLFRPRQQ